MRYAGLVIVLGFATQGCAFLKPSTDNTSATEKEQITRQLQTYALTTLATEYTVIGDAHLPSALRYPNEYVANATDILESIENGEKELARLPDNIDDSAGTSNDAGTTKSDNLFIENDIWDRIRAGFKMEDRDHPRIDQQLKWFASNQEYMDRVAERATPYMRYIVDTLEANDIPLEIALLPIVESAFKPFAYSHGRASGIWQFIPSTGKLYGLKQDWWYDGRRDVYESTQAAVKLLGNLAKEFDGDWMLALAAYNSGSGNVRRAITYNRKRGKSTDFFALRLPPETQSYVPKLLALKKLLAEPAKYNITFAPISNEPYFDKVELDSQIDLALAAELADVELETLYQLNPGYNRWATSPTGNHHLLLPLDTIETFKANLADYPPEKRLRWIRHQIKSGETISTIASKYHVSTDTIKRVNNMRNNRLRAGRSLTIPVASRSLSSYTLSASQRQQQTQNTPHRGGVKITYIVRPGDTLWDIAQQHNVGVRTLAKWNGMAPRDPLSIGQELVIWSSKRKAEAGEFIQVAAPPQREMTQRIGYRVRKGDSLARIANRFRVSVGELLRWNKKLSRKQYLQPGQYVVVYVDVASTSGRT